MQPGRAIINISSILGIATAGLPQAAYSDSKAAIGGLTRDLAHSDAAGYVTGQAIVVDGCVTIT